MVNYDFLVMFSNIFIIYLDICVFIYILQIYIFISQFIVWGALFKESLFICNILNSMFYSILKCKMYQELVFMFFQINYCIDYYEVYLCYYYYDNIMIRSSYFKLFSKRNCFYIFE